MDYILLDFGDVQAYQVISNGVLIRYATLTGDDFTFPPGFGGHVIDANPPKPVWDVPEVVAVPVNVPPPRRVSKLQFVGLLGKDFHTILTVAKSSVEVEMFVRMLDWATPEADGTSIDLDDPRVVYALNSLEAAGLMAAGRAQEILNA